MATTEKWVAHELPIRDYGWRSKDYRTRGWAVRAAKNHGPGRYAITRFVKKTGTVIGSYWQGQSGSDVIEVE